MLIVKLEKKVNIEKALRKLKTKVIKTKQLRRLRDGKAFTKPSAKKRLQKQKAVYLQKKWNAENQD
jgi:ribosomal protein S21